MLARASVSQRQKRTEDGMVIGMDETEAECFMLDVRRMKTLKTNLRVSQHLAMLLFFDRARLG